MFTVNLILCVLFLVLTVTNCANISSAIDSSGCILPKYPTNGRWSISNGPNHAPDEKVENGAVISVTCQNQFRLNGSSVLKCSDGKWNAVIGQCLELCPPIVEKYSTEVNCTTNGEPSDCKTPTNGTIATIKCAPFYENQELNRNPFRICQNGRWNEEILSCSAVCGLEPTTSKNKSLEHFYPWNVLIYETYENVTNTWCAGTLINEKTVLTAAVCVTEFTTDFDERVDPLEKSVHIREGMIVAAGKMVKEYKNPDSDKEAQYSSIQHVFVPHTYKGHIGKLLSDIAVVIITTPFKITARVGPACVDWSNKYREEFRYPKAIKVAAPVKSLENSNNSANVFEFNVRLWNDFTCRSFVSNTHDQFYIMNDKYCSENLTSSFNDDNCANQINRGAGLITKNSFSEKYYVVGVTSEGAGANDSDCYSKTFALFTRVSDYISFISEKTSLYSTIERAHFQTSCGFKSLQAQTLIVNGGTVAKGDYPWQVAIYDISTPEKSLICGGSLINQRVVLTAAHCVTKDKGQKLPKEKYIIAVGKYYRNFSDPGDNKNSQFSALKEIIVPTEYQGRLQNYLGDIAVLISETSFVLSREIQPICVDWEAKYEGQFLKPNITGFVAGWGFTEENKNPSQELKDLEVPYIDPEQCKNELPLDYDVYLTIDKLCSGFLKKGKTVCKGDSGGGLVFKNRNDGRYYLAGIVSLSPQSPTGGCNSEQYALYTRVSRYTTNFIRDIVSSYWS